MDIFTQHETLSFWITQYGSFALFALLALGILALPIPDETLMVLAGIMVARERLLLFPTLTACYSGAICGISVSFLLGSLFGRYLIRHYGGWLGFTESKREQIHRWFKKFGKWTLFFGYFIPGVRHLTGLLAGMGKLEYAEFALYAFSGAFLWASTFFSIGYYVGDYWLARIEEFEISFGVMIFALAILVVCLIIANQLFRKK